jgi:hypothetical protein
MAVWTVASESSMDRPLGRTMRGRAARRDDNTTEVYGSDAACRFAGSKAGLHCRGKSGNSKRKQQAPQSCSKCAD